MIEAESYLLLFFLSFLRRNIFGAAYILNFFSYKRTKTRRFTLTARLRKLSKSNYSKRFLNVWKDVKAAIRRLTSIHTEKTTFSRVRACYYRFEYMHETQHKTSFFEKQVLFLCFFFGYLIGLYFAQKQLGVKSYVDVRYE